MTAKPYAPFKNCHFGCIMTYCRALMIASVVLLPLLGLTWAFGVLTVNEHAIAFAWLFTIFNSLQVHIIPQHTNALPA